MNDTEQRSRMNRNAMESNESWYLRTPEDEYERCAERERRQDIEDQKSEWEWDCKRDASLTEKSNCECSDTVREKDWRRPLTAEELEEQEYQKWFKWDEERKWNRQWR